MLIGQGHMMVVPQSVGSISKTNLGSIRERCLTLSLKSEGVLVHQTRSQLVESVERNNMVIALLGRTIVLDVAKVATR